MIESFGGKPPEKSSGFIASITTLPLKFSGPASAIASSAALPSTASTSNSPCAAACGERAGFDAGSIAGQPFAQLGLARVARADHHVVAATAEPGCQAPPNLAASQHANPALR